MRQEDLGDLLRRQPFLPLRLHITNGVVFEIRHPDMARVGRSSLTLALPPEPLEERFAVISLLHIVWIEFSDQAS
jgi:hypothetical protein